MTLTDIRFTRLSRTERCCNHLFLVDKTKRIKLVIYKQKIAEWKGVLKYCYFVIVPSEVGTPKIQEMHRARFYAHQT